MKQPSFWKALNDPEARKEALDHYRRQRGLLLVGLVILAVSSLAWFHFGAAEIFIYLVLAGGTYLLYVQSQIHRLKEVEHRKQDQKPP